MKKLRLFRLLAAIMLLTLGLAFYGCGNVLGNEEQTSVWAQTTPDGLIEVTFSNRALSARSAVGPQHGDYFQITLDGFIISRGTVNVSVTTMTFNPQGGGASFHGSITAGQLRIPALPTPAGTLNLVAVLVIVVAPSTNGGTGEETGSNQPGTVDQPGQQQPPPGATSGIYGYFGWRLDGGNITITGFIPTMPREITIPSEINGYPVRSIGPRAFYLRSITSVTIPNSVIYIGAWAFRYSGLESVTIPNSVTHIGGFAFYGNRLESVTISNSVTQIRVFAFSNNQLTSVTIPNSVTRIETSAFARNQLTSVTIGNSVTQIGASAFRVNQLTSIIIPNSVTLIETGAFARNQLTSITIGQT